MGKLRPALLLSGIAEKHLGMWTSHCFRRGSGLDVLEDRGLKAMLAHGSWSSPNAAAPYASRDEQQAVGLAAACMVIDKSDDESGF